MSLKGPSFIDQLLKSDVCFEKQEYSNEMKMARVRDWELKEKLSRHHYFFVHTALREMCQDYPDILFTAMTDNEQKDEVCNAIWQYTCKEGV